MYRERYIVPAKQFRRSATQPDTARRFHGNHHHDDHHDRRRRRSHPRCSTPPMGYAADDHDEGDHAAEMMMKAITPLMIMMTAITELTMA
jgi:hypothetical protein